MMTLSPSPASPSTPSSAVDLGEEFRAYHYALSQFSAVALADLQGKILEANDQFCSLLGYERLELIGQSYSQFESRIQAETDADNLWASLTEGSAWRGKIRYCDRNRQHHWLDTSVIPLKSANGKIERYLFAGIDITQQQQAQEKTQLQQQRLQKQQNQNQALQIRLDGNNRILNLIVNGAPLEQSLTAIANLTERLAANRFHCAIMVLDPMSGNLVHRAAPSLPTDFIDTMDDQPITPRGGAFAAAAHSQRTITIPDIAADSNAHYVNDVALQNNLRACLACPILVRNKVAAVLGIYYRQPQYPSERDRSLMSRAVELTQVAMERHRSETALHSKLEQTLLLGKITQEIRQSLDIKEVFQTAVAQVRSLLKADRVAISHFAPPPGSPSNARQGFSAPLQRPNCFIAEHVVPPFRPILGQPVKESADQSALQSLEDASAPITPILTPDPLEPTTINVLEDIYYSGLTDGQIHQLEELEIQASIAVPIMLGDGQSSQSKPWGMLYIQQCSAPRQWQDSELSFVRALTVQLSVAIQQANLLSQAQQKSARLQQLLETVQRQQKQQSHATERERRISSVIQQIHKTRDISKILATATEEARSLLNCDRVLIYRFLPNWHREIAHESFGNNRTALKQQKQSPTWIDRYLRQHKGGRYRDGKSAVVTDIFNSNYSDEHIKCFVQQGIRAFMVVPIFVGDRLWGLMGAYHHEHPRNWQFEDLSSLERISGQLGVAFQQAELLKQLKTAKEKADAANQAKGTFLANMSHELRTPLNAILGFSQLMNRDPATTSEQRNTLNIINRSGAHLLALINDVLDMSKIEAGNMSLYEVDFDLQNICDSIHEMFQLKAKSKGIELRLERDASVPRYVHSDECKLRQVLMNLVSNSLKFTSQGHITLKIWREKPTASAPQKRRFNDPITLWFSVSDTGTGIAPQEMKHLFDAFSQTESGRQAQEGTGLGLPISKEFVQLMKGQLSLDSKLGQGTTAKFSIEVSPVMTSIVRAPQERRVRRIAPGQPDYRLLVVEDRAENRTLLTQLLESVGFSVRIAENGKAAIAQWQAWQPHLIWMDLQMPIMNGLAATRVIRLLEKQKQAIARSNSKPLDSPQSNHKTYILAITANTFEETRSLARKAGVDDFIQKPFQEALIFDKLSQYLGINYCYETIETNQKPHLVAVEQLHEPDQIEHLEKQCQAMGNRWRATLYHAAITLDEETVQRQIQAIGAQQRPLKVRLQNWYQTLRLDKIAELTRPPFQSSA